MYRPKDWKNPFNPAAVTVRDTNNKPISHCAAYEAGDDAMLSTLWKLAEESPTKTFTFDANMQYAYARIFDKA